MATQLSRSVQPDRKKVKVLVLVLAFLSFGPDEVVYV